MEFKWLWTLKWGESRSANGFPANSWRSQKNNGLVGKRGNRMVIVEVRSLSGWFSNRPLQRELENFEKVHQFSGRCSPPPGNMPKLPKDNLQRTSFPTRGVSDVSWGFPSLPRSFHQLPPLYSMPHVDCVTKWTRLSCPPSSGLLQPMGGSDRNLEGWFILQIPSLPGQPGLPNSSHKMAAPTAVLWVLFTILFFAFPALGMLPAPCSYLPWGTALSFGISLNPGHTSASSPFIKLSVISPNWLCLVFPARTQLVGAGWGVGRMVGWPV